MYAMEHVVRTAACVEKVCAVRHMLCKRYLKKPEPPAGDRGSGGDVLFADARLRAPSAPNKPPARSPSSSACASAKYKSSLRAQTNASARAQFGRKLEDDDARFARGLVDALARDDERGEHDVVEQRAPARRDAQHDGRQRAVTRETCAVGRDELRDRGIPVVVRRTGRARERALSGR
jgi:hypothetical protein